MTRTIPPDLQSRLLTNHVTVDQLAALHDSGFDILVLLFHDWGPWSVKEIARRLSLPYRKIRHQVRRLSDTGLVDEWVARHGWAISANGILVLEIAGFEGGPPPDFFQNLHDQIMNYPQRKANWASMRSFWSRLIFARDNHRCQLCGSTKDLTVDHRLPLSRGGNNQPANFQTLCRSCNCKKGARRD